MFQHYQLHGLHIRAGSNHPAVGRMLHRTLQYKNARVTSPGPRVDITLDFGVERAPVAGPEEARYVGASDRCGIAVWKGPDALVLSCGESSVVVRPTTGTATATLPDVHAAPSEQRRSLLFHLIVLSLVILLRYRGWYALHAAALVRNGRGMLLVAGSGCGKSTVTLSLVRSGWKYVSDDTVLLRAERDHVQAHSFRRTCCVDPPTVAHFPELNAETRPASLSDAAKWQLDIESVYPDRFRDTCTPCVLVLPSVVDVSYSSVEPTDNISALAAIAHQGGMFLTPDPDVAGDHLDTLGQLIGQSSAYRLHAGRDALEAPDTLPRLLAPLLD